MIRSIRASMNGPGGPMGIGVGPPVGGANCDRFEPREVIRPEPRFEPRPVVHPTPRFEPRPVVHPTPRLEPGEPLPPPCEPERTLETKSPIKPPWSQLPWMSPLQTAPSPKVKVVQKRPDMVHKGMLIDFFI